MHPVYPRRSMIRGGPAVDVGERCIDILLSEQVVTSYEYHHVATTWCAGPASRTAFHCHLHPTLAPPQGHVLAAQTGNGRGGMAGDNEKHVGTYSGRARKKVPWSVLEDVQGALAGLI